MTPKEWREILERFVDRTANHGPYEAAAVTLALARLERAERLLRETAKRENKGPCWCDYEADWHGPHCEQLRAFLKETK